MRTLILIGSVALSLAGCESPEHKAERLRTAAVTACIGVNDMAPTDVTYDARHAKCDVAQREYTAFLSGR